MCLQLRGKNGGDKKRPDPVALLAGRLEQQLMNCQGDQVSGKASLPQIISPLIPTSAGKKVGAEDGDSIETLAYKKAKKL